MSETLIESGPLYVGTFCGPEDGDAPRRRWQFTVADGSDYAVLTDAEAEQVLIVMAGRLGYGLT